jgi:signal transduction histidine kinase
MDRLLEYAAAAALAVTALSLRGLFQPFLGPMQPFAHGFVAVAASVLLIGWRPAVLAAVVSYFGGSVLFMHADPTVTWTGRQEVAAFLVYSMSAGLIILMGHRARTAEREAAAANNQLRDADRKKNEFLAMLSHELRNPIGVIATAVRRLERDERDPARQSTIAILSRQVAQVRRLVEDLLDVGRITRGRLTLHPETADVRRCLHDAADAHRDTVARKRQLLRVTIPSDPVIVTVDAARLVQVLSNLVDNASKYSQEGAEIQLALSTSSAARIEVSDDGPGIATDVLPQVFDLFDQGPASQSGGLGVGLGLCKEIVELHGGSIEAMPNPHGRGTTFVIELPKERDLRDADVVGSAHGRSHA